MENVIRMDRRVNEIIPSDLMTFREFADKYNMKVGYLYKLQRNGAIQRHKRGMWKISEGEVLRVLQRLR